MGTGRRPATASGAMHTVDMHDLKPNGAKKPYETLCAAATSIRFDQFETGQKRSLLK